MRKLLALVLAMVMTLGLATVGTNAFTDDAAVAATGYEEAVAVLNGMGVFEGFPDGEFKPNDSITRAQVAAIIYRIVTGDVDGDYKDNYKSLANFTDLEGAGWAAGYIGYCANAQIVKGYGNGKFGPSDPVTGYQALAMILRAVGYDKNHEFEGAGYEVKVAEIAETLNMLKNVDPKDLTGSASRASVAQILFAAIQVPTVTYTPALNYTKYNSVTAEPKTENLNESLAWREFKLDFDYSVDKWGRPSAVWYKENTRGATNWTTDNRYNPSTDKVYCNFDYEPIAKYTKLEKGCDIIDELGINPDSQKRVYVDYAYVNGFEQLTTNVTDRAGNTYYGSITDNENNYADTKVGRLVEFYDVDGALLEVVIDTYLGQVTRVQAEEKDSNDHISHDDFIQVGVWKTGTRPVAQTATTTVTVEGNEYANGDFVLVYVDEAQGQAEVKDANGNVTAYAQSDDRVTFKDGTATPINSLYAEVVGKATVLENKALTKAVVGDTADRQIDGKDYKGAFKFLLDDAQNDRNHLYNWYLDQYENVIGSAKIDQTWQVLKSIKWIADADKGGHAEATMIDFNGKETTYVVTTIDGIQDVEGALDDTAWVGRINNADNGDTAEGQFTQGHANATPMISDNLNGQVLTAAEVLAINGNRTNTTNAYVSTDARRNTLYLGYAMFRVEQLANGTVRLDGWDYNDAPAAEAPDFIDYVANATIDTDTSSIVVGGVRVANITNQTKIMVRNTVTGGFEYKTYTGTSSGLPKYNAGSCDVYYHIMLTTNAAGATIKHPGLYVDYMYIKDHAETTRTRFMFAGDGFADTATVTINGVNYWAVNATVDEKAETVYFAQGATFGATSAAMKEWVTANAGKLFYFKNVNNNLVNTADNYDLVNELTDEINLGDGVRVDYLSSYGNIYYKNGTLETGTDADGTAAYHITSAGGNEIDPVVFGYVGGKTVNTVAGFEGLFKGTNGAPTTDTGIWVVRDTVYNKTIGVYVGKQLSDDHKLTVTSDSTRVVGTTATANAIAVPGTNDTYSFALRDGFTAADVAGFKWDGATGVVVRKGSNVRNANNVVVANTGNIADQGTTNTFGYLRDDFDEETVAVALANRTATYTFSVYSESGKLYPITVTVGNAVVPALESVMVGLDGTANTMTQWFGANGSVAKVQNQMAGGFVDGDDADTTATLTESIQAVLDNAAKVINVTPTGANKIYFDVLGDENTVLKIVSASDAAAAETELKKATTTTAREKIGIPQGNTTDNGGIVVVQLFNKDDVTDANSKFIVFRITANGGAGLFATNDTVRTTALATISNVRKLSATQDVRATLTVDVPAWVPAGATVKLEGNVKVGAGTYAVADAFVTRADPAADNTVVTAIGNEWDAGATLDTALTITTIADEAAAGKVTVEVTTENSTSLDDAVNSDIDWSGVTVTFDKVETKYVLGSKTGAALTAAQLDAGVTTAIDTAAAGTDLANVKLTAAGDAVLTAAGYNPENVTITFANAALVVAADLVGDISSGGAGIDPANITAVGDDYAYVIINKGAVPLTATMAAAVSAAGSFVGGAATKTLDTFMSAAEAAKYDTDAATQLTISTPNAPVLGGNVNVTVKAAGDNLEVYQYTVTVTGKNGTEDFTKQVTLTNGSANTTGATFAITGVKGDIVINSITVAKASDLLTVKKVEVDATGFVLTITMSEAIENAPAKFSKTTGTCELIAENPVTIDGAVVTIKVAGAALADTNVFTVLNTLKSAATPAKTVTLANGTKGATGITITLDSTKAAGATFNVN